jgi:hypothetical protein
MQLDLPDVVQELPPKAVVQETSGQDRLLEEQDVVMGIGTLHQDVVTF